MKMFVWGFILSVLCLQQAYSQYSPYGGCCASPYYQTPGVCCSHPCCIQTMAPVYCCGQAREIIKLKLELKTYEVWKADYANDKSDAYKAFEKRFIAAVKKAYATSKSKDLAVRVSGLARGSTIVTFVLAFTKIDMDPLLPMRIAIGTGYIPNPLDATKIKVYPSSMVLKDKVLNVPTHIKPKIILDCAPKQQTDEQMEDAIYQAINEVRPIHYDAKLSRGHTSDLHAKTWSLALAKLQQLKFSKNNEKSQSENYYSGCVKPGQYLSGTYVFRKWYDEVKVYFGKGSLVTKLKDAKRFINLIYKATTKIDVGVSRYTKGDYTCFVVVAFFSPKALTQTPKQLVANILRGKYGATGKRHEITKPVEEFEQVM